MKGLSLIALAVTIFYAPAPALAYLDPGSGSYMLQVTVGLIAGGLFMLKQYWGMIKTYVSNFLNKDKK